MMGVAAVSPGVIAASYPKTIGPFESSRKANADGGTRRTYNGSVDQYVDSPTSGLTTWAAGGPTPGLLSAGYTLQFQVEATNLEGPSSGSDICRLRIAGVAQGMYAGAANAGVDTSSPSAGIGASGDHYCAYAAPSSGQTVSGAITWGNYYTVNTGNTSHTGDFILRYRYTRS